MGLLTSLLLPFINITKIIYVPRPAISTIDTADMENIVMANASSVSLSWINLIVTIYLIGVIYFCILLIACIILRPPPPCIIFIILLI
jgi:hypothetical protein